MTRFPLVPHLSYERTPDLSLVRARGGPLLLNGGGSGNALSQREPQA